MAATLRMAREGDGAEIAAIYAPYVHETAITFEEVAPTAEQFAERIRAGIATHPWLAAEADGRVAGYAYASRHRERASYRWSVDVSVYLDRSWHRRGLGRALYTALLAALEAQGFARAYAGITLPNLSSVSLHEAMGFVPVGVYAGVGYKMGRWRDVGWWERPLAPAASQPAEPLAVSQLESAGTWQACLEEGARLLRI